jgi:hypothetical protein
MLAHADNESGILRVSVSAMHPIQGDGDLISVLFSAVETTSREGTPVRVTAGLFEDSQGAGLAAVLVGGEVIVIEPSADPQFDLHDDGIIDARDLLMLIGEQKRKGAAEGEQRFLHFSRHWMESEN